MDLNHLLSRQQTSTMQADRALCVSSRVAHQGMADAYASQANDLMDEAGGDARVSERTDNPEQQS